MRILSSLAPAVVVGALAVLPLAQAPQKPQPPPQVPTFRAGVNFVRVDVIVSDRHDQLITDLSEADFEVTEDGKPQKIETFKLINVEGQPKPGDAAPREIRTEYDEESEAARDDVRLFVIFLDDYHVRRASAMAVRSQLAAFVQKQLGPNDLCGIMYPEMPVSAVLLGRNQQALLSTLQHFEGRKYDYQPRYPFEEQFAMYPAATVEQIRNQVSLSALESLVTHLGSLREGRKAVILVSEGYTGVLPAQLNDPISSMPGLGNPARNAQGLESVDDRTAFFASLDVQQMLRPVYDAANRNNTAIYALDPRGLATGEFGLAEGVGQSTDRQLLQSTVDSLRQLADQTDGRAIVNRNDLAAGLKQVVRDSSTYYLLGYNSSNTTADGKFHEIKVKARRPGVQVRARRGYWALTKEEMARALAPPPPPVPTAVSKALGSIAEPRQGRYIREWVGTGRGDGGRTRVTFVWDPLPPVPGLERSQRLSVALQAARGGRVYYNGTVGNQPPPSDGARPAAGAPEAPVPAPAPALVTFEAEPGTLQLRITIKGEQGETLDSETRDLPVPDLTQVRTALSTPAVFRTANAREFQALMANPSPVPTPAREFRRTERLVVRFDAYAPGSEVPTVSARVLNRLGKGMADLTVKAPQAPTTVYQLDLPLAGFAAGEYLVEVKATGPSGEAVELVPIKITS
jgi:VWFA-related protein